MSENASPSDRRHARTRQAIIDAARKIITEEGIDALSIRTLADRVDYSPSALYKYFANKEEIIEAIRQEGWEIANQYSLSRMEEGLSFGEMLRRSGLAYLEFSAAYPEHYRLMFHATDSIPQSLAAFEKDPKFMLMVEMFEQAAAEGKIALPESYTPLLLRYHVWFVVHGIAMLRQTMMRDIQDEFDKISFQVMDAFLESLLPKE